MPTAIEFVTFTPSDEYKSDENVFKDFASWILPASKGTFMDGIARHGTRVEDKEIAHILFHSSSVQDMHELGKDDTFKVEAYHRLASLCKIKDPISMSLVYVEFDDEWETIKTLVDAPFTEISIVTAKDAETFEKTKAGHKDLSRRTHGLKGTIGNAVFGTVVFGGENVSLAISAWESVESHLEVAASESFSSAAATLLAHGPKAEMFHIKFETAP